MNTNVLFESTYIAILALLNLVMIFFFMIRAKRSKLYNFFILTNIMVFIWLFCQVVELNIPKIMDNQWYFAITLMPYCFISVIWLFFCIEYAESNKFNNQYFQGLLFLPPLTCYLVAITNKFHHLFYKPIIAGDWSGSYSTFFWINMFFSYLYIFLADIILVKNYFRDFGNVKKQSLLLVIASCIPIIANILHVFKFINLSYDITSISFAIPLFIFAIANYKYEFMDIVPSALKKIIDNVGDGILVIDSKQKVLFYNKTIIEIFANSLSFFKNMNLTFFIDSLINHEKFSSDSIFIEDAFSDDSTRKKIEFNFGEKTLVLKVQTISSSRGDNIVKIAVFSDITEYKIIEKQLEHYAVVSQALAVEKERLRFARDIHDTVGHSMTLLISLLEVAKIQLHNDVNDAHDKVEHAISTAKEGFMELRKSVSGLKNSNQEQSTLSTRISLLVERFNASDVKIDFLVNGTEQKIADNVSEVLYRAVQEAITNSVRHGKASTISIIMNFEVGLVRLFIIDNGNGSSFINKGFGLLAMEYRVHSIGGSINMGSDGESGFNIRIEIPLEEIIITEQ